MYSVAGEAAPVFPGVQALLDTPTPQWEDILDAGLEMLSDLHFGMQPAEQPLVDVHTMQVTTSDALALPQALLKKANLPTRKTKMLIQAVIGPDTNKKCDECRRTFSTMKRLRVHMPQHFTVTFCPCGVRHFYRNAILPHQRTQQCYVGRLFEVDQDSYTEFRDLLLPHVFSPSRQESLLQGFPNTRPTVESDYDATGSGSDPVVPLSKEVQTRPLRVMVTCAGRSVQESTQPLPSQLSPTPASHRKRRKRAKTTTVPDDILDADIRDHLGKLQQRFTRLIKEQ